MQVAFVSTGEDQNCGIATYTSSLQAALNVVSTRIPLRLRSPNVFHYARQGFRAGRTDADVIHIQHEYGIFGPKSIASWAFFLALFVATTGRQVPVVTTFHSAWSAKTISRPLRRFKEVYVRLNNRLLAAVTDYALFLSEETQETFEQTARVPQTKVLSHGVQTDVQTMDQREAKLQFGCDPDVPLVVEPGFVRPQKGYECFLDVAKRVDRASFLIGGGPQAGNYLDYFDRLKEQADGAAGVTGVLDDEDFHALFNAMDLALLPYETVTQSGIVNWCLAYEVPVVATDLDRFRELNESYGFPALFPEGDTEAAAEVVRHVLSDPEDVDDAMRSYRDEHSMQNVANCHREIYESL